MQVKCEIVDKRIKDGFFSTSYLVAVRPIEKLKPVIIEENFSINGYYGCNIGDIIILNFEEGDDGLYYVYTEFGYKKN